MPCSARSCSGTCCVSAATSTTSRSPRPCRTCSASTPNWCSMRAPSTSRSTTCWCVSSRRRAWPSIRVKRPFVVVDPRAGHGPGIGGFKADSELGVAMRAGHPCYFVGFTPEPMPGQTIEDIIYAEAAFLEKVIALHPDAEGKPCVIGNCQAGWAVMMVAAIRPELFGPIIVPGSPLSYWAGVEGENPMRYTGGMAGGSWMTALTGDLGDGKFDGGHLVAELREPEPGEHLLDQELRPVVEGRHRRPALHRVREVVGRPRQPQCRRDPVDRRPAVRRQPAGHRPRSSPAAATASTCATSARRSSASAPRATTSRRRSRRWAGSSTCTAATTTCAPAARPSSTRCTTPSATWASSSPAAWPRRSTRSSPPTST